MVFLPFLVLVFLVSTTSGQMCSCPPAQFETDTQINQLLVSGNGTDFTMGQRFDATMYVDYTIQKLAYTFDFGQRQIIDWIEARHYVIDFLGSCEYYPTVGGLFYCLPEGVELLRRTYIGEGDDKVHIDDYKFEIGGYRVTGGWTQPECAEVMIVYEGELSPGVEMSQTQRYTGTTTGITDPSVFDPPLGCVAAPPEKNPKAMDNLPSIMRISKYFKSSGKNNEFWNTMEHL